MCGHAFRRYRAPPETARERLVDGLREQPRVLDGERASGDEDVDLLVEVLDLDNDLWVPATVDGDLSDATTGLILAEAAADEAKPADDAEKSE